MRNNKGFLVYELIISFSLTAVIALTLISTTFILKNKSDRISLETNININRTILMNHIREDIVDYGLIGIIPCLDEANNPIASCVTFKYALSNDIVLKIDKTNNIIEYGDYIKQYKEDISLEGESMIKVTTIPGIEEGYTDSFLEIIIPMKSNLLESDYGINIIHKYDSRINNFTAFNF